MKKVDLVNLYMPINQHHRRKVKGTGNNNQLVCDQRSARFGKGDLVIKVYKINASIQESTF